MDKSGRENSETKHSVGRKADQQTLRSIARNDRTEPSADPSKSLPANYNGWDEV